MRLGHAHTRDLNTIAHLPVYGWSAKLNRDTCHFIPHEVAASHSCHTTSQGKFIGSRRLGQTKLDRLAWRHIRNLDARRIGHANRAMEGAHRQRAGIEY